MDRPLSRSSSRNSNDNFKMDRPLSRSSSRNSNFHDHSTFQGKLYGAMNKSHWTIAVFVTILFIVTFVLLFYYDYIGPDFSDSMPLNLTQSPQLLNSKTNFPIINKKVLTYKGNGSDIFPPSIPMSMSPIPAYSFVNIENTQIDAPAFSQLLANSNTSLITEIYLNNVTVSGVFTRVFLPNIKIFCLNQRIGVIERLETYQEKFVLKSNLFFDLSEDGSSWDITQVGNLGVDIIVKVDGFKFLHVNKSGVIENKGELIVYLPYCDEVLKNTEVFYKVLSLATCEISVNSIPTSLQYLNLFDVMVRDGTIAQILQKFTEINYLFIDLPNETIDLSEIPRSLICLSVSTMSITFKNPPKNGKIFPIIPELNSLSLGFSNVSSEVYKNLGKIFPRLNNVGAFGAQSANYELLDSCIKWEINNVIMEEFNFNKTNERDEELERILKGIGIDGTNRNFMVSIPKYSDSVVGSPLNGLQDHDNRYTLLGWYKFLTYDAYVVADKYVIEIS